MRSRFYLSFLLSLGIALQSGASPCIAATEARQTSGFSRSPQYVSIEQLARQGRYADAYTRLQQVKSTTGGGAALAALSAVVTAESGHHLLQSLEDARAAAKGFAAPGFSATARERSIVVSNLGVLLQQNGEKGPALDKYKQAIALDNTNWRAHLGYAQMMAVDGFEGRALAEKELSEPEMISAARSDLDAADEIASTYLVLHMPKQARQIIQSATKSNPAYPASLQRSSTRRLYIKACLQIIESSSNPKANTSIDLAQLSSLISQAIAAKDFDMSLALSLAGPACRKALGTELIQEMIKVLAASRDHMFTGQVDFYQSLGYALESPDIDGRIDAVSAEQAYRTALMWSQGAPRETISLMGNLHLQGKTLEIPAIIGTKSSADNTAKKTYKDRLERTLERVLRLIATGEIEKGRVHVWQGVLKNLKCGCRISVIEYKLESNEGILLARIEDKKEPGATVIYDTGKIDAQGLMPLFKGATKELEAMETRDDQPITSVHQLVRVLQKAEREGKGGTNASNANAHTFNYWSFAHPSLQLP